MRSRRRRGLQGRSGEKTTASNHLKKKRWRAASTCPTRYQANDWFLPVLAVLAKKIQARMVRQAKFRLLCPFLERLLASEFLPGASALVSDKGWSILCGHKGMVYMNKVIPCET